MSVKKDYEIRINLRMLVRVIGDLILGALMLCVGCVLLEVPPDISLWRVVGGLTFIWYGLRIGS